MCSARGDLEVIPRSFITTVVGIKRPDVFLCIVFEGRNVWTKLNGVTCVLTPCFLCLTNVWDEDGLRVSKYGIL